jgi:hypothetical protein
MVTAEFFINLHFIKAKLCISKKNYIKQFLIFAP